MTTKIESEEWVSPCHGLSKQNIHGFSVFSLREIGKEIKFPFDFSSSHDLYFMYISGENKSRYLMKRSLEKDPAIRSRTEQIIEECFILFDTAWISFEDLNHFYISPKFSLFVLLELDNPSKINIASVMLFHHNPHVGTFVPLLNVHSSKQKMKIGPTSLMLIQHLYFRRFATYKLCIWFASMQNDKKSEKLFLFYRKLGLFVMYPRNIPIKSLLRKELYKDMCKELFRKKIGEKTEDASVSSCSYDFKGNQENYLLMTHRAIVLPETGHVVTKSLLQKSHVISENLVCELCGLERSVAEDIEPYKRNTVHQFTEKNSREFYSFCRHEIKNSHIQLHDKNGSKPVCGMTFCFSCRNSFFFENDLFSMKFCPVHASCHSKTERYEIPRDNSVARLSQKFITKHLATTQELKDKFFSGMLENGSNGSQECKMCLYDGKGSNAGLDSFCQYSKIDERSIANVGNSQDCYDYQVMKLCCNKINTIRLSLKVKCSNKRLHKYNYLDCNVGLPWSSLINDVFGIKYVDAGGDCGFDSIRIALNSAEKDLKKRILTEFENYISTQMFQYKSLMKMFDKHQKRVDSTKAKNSKKKKGKIPKRVQIVIDIIKRGYLEVKDLRHAMFLTKLNTDYHDLYENLNNIQEDFQPFTSDGVLLNETNELEEGAPDKIFTEEEISLNAMISHFFQLLCKERKEEIEKGVKRKKKEDHVNAILDNFEFGFLSKTIDNCFKKYSCTSSTTKGGSSSILWTTLHELQYLPCITNGLVGVIVLVSSDTQYTHPSKYIYDAEYYTNYNKHIMKSCQYFILIKFENMQHFEVVYDRKNKTAIFPTDNVKNSDQLGETMLPWNIIKSFVLDAEVSYNMFGSKLSNGLSFPELNKHGLLSGTQCTYPQFYPLCSDSLIAKIETKMTESSAFKDSQKECFYYPEWYQLWVDITAEIEKSSLNNVREFLQRKVLGMVENDVTSSFLPIIFIKKGEEFDSSSINKKIFLLQNVNSRPTDRDSDDASSYSTCSSNGSVASTVGKGSRFVVLDANKVTFDSKYMNMFAREICGTTNESGNHTFHYEVDFLELFEKYDSNIWKFPKIKDVNRLCSMIWFNECKASDTDGNQSPTQFNGCLQQIFGILPTGKNVSKLKLDLLKERSMLLCIQAETWCSKQRFYKYYVAFSNEDYQLYRHMLFCKEEVIMEFLDKKYEKEKLLKSFIMNSKSSQIRKIVHDTFAPFYQNPNEQSAYMERVANELFLTVWNDNQYSLFALLPKKEKNTSSEPNKVLSGTVDFEPKQLGNNHGYTYSMPQEKDDMKVQSNSDVRSVVSDVLLNITTNVEQTMKVNKIGSSSSDSETKENNEKKSSVGGSESRTTENDSDFAQKKRKLSKVEFKTQKFSLPEVLFESSQNCKKNLTNHGYLLQYITYLWEYDFKTALLDGTQKTLKDILIPLVFHEKERKNFESQLVTCFIKKYNISKGDYGNPTKLVKDHWSFLRNAVLYHMGILMIVSDAVIENKSLFSYEINSDVLKKYQNDIQATMIYASNESDDESDVSSIGSINSEVLFGYTPKTVNFTKIKQQIKARHKCNKKDFQVLLYLIKKMEQSTDNWNEESPSKISSTISQRIDIHRRTPSNLFQWKHGKFGDDCCLRIEMFSAKYKEVNSDFLTRKEIPSPMMNIAIKIMNFEYSKKVGVLCLGTNLFSNTLSNVRSAQVLWTNKSLRRKFVNIFSSVFDGDNVNIVKNYEKILIPWTRDNHHLLFLVNTKDKEVVIHNPNKKLLESEFVFVQLVKDIKYLVIALLSFGWDGEFTITSVQQELNSYTIKNPADSFFPSSNQNESSAIILMNIFAIFTKQKEPKETFQFFSSTCIPHFRQFLLNLFSEYHSCTSIRNHTKTSEQSTTLLQEADYFSPIILGTKKTSYNKHAETLIGMTDETCISSISGLTTDVLDHENNGITESTKSKKSDNLSNSKTSNIDARSEEKKKDASIIVKNQKLLKENEIKEDKAKKPDDLSDTVTESTGKTLSGASSSTSTRSEMIDKNKNKIFVEEKIIGRNKELIEVCGYLDGEDKGSINKQISISILDRQSRINSAITKKLTYPIDEKNPSKEFENMKIDDIDEEDLEYYEQNKVFRSFELIQKKLSCDYIMCKRDGYYGDNTPDYLLSQSNRVVVDTRPANEYFDNMNFYFLDETAMQEFEQHTDHGKEVKLFNNELREADDDETDKKCKRRTWTKMPAVFKKLLKNYLIESRQAVAKYFQDYHFIKKKANGQLWGYCMHNRQVTYAEELSEEYIVKIEHYKKEHVQACQNVGSLVPLCIGKRGRNRNRGKNQKNLNRSESTPSIQYPQGKKQKCLPYSLKSAFFYYMQNNAEDNERKNIQSIIDGIDRISETEKISSNSKSVTGHQKCIFYSLKELFDSSGGWIMTRLDDTSKKYMQKNYVFLEEYLEKYRKSIFVMQICDNAGDDSHWVCACNLLLFDTRHKFTKKLSEKNLSECSSEKSYKQIGKFYEIKKRAKKKRSKRMKRKKPTIFDHIKIVDEVNDGSKKVKFTEDLTREEKKDSSFQISFVYTKLNDIQRNLIAKKREEMKQKKNTEVVLACRDVPVKKDQFLKLSGKGWLNTDVVDAYSRLLANRHAMLLQNGCVRSIRKKSFFSGSYFLGGLFDNGTEIDRLEKFINNNNEQYSMKDIFSSDKLFFPYCNGSHWILYVVFVKKKEIQIYNSMGMLPVDEVKSQKLLDILGKIHKITENEEMNKAKWTLSKSSLGNVPQQENLHDCGVFILIYIDLLSLGEPLSFTQEQATEYRQRIILALIQGDAFRI